MHPVFEFHISRKARDFYHFDQSLFSLTGNVLFANFRSVREFAQRMNSHRDLVHYPEQAVRAGELNAMGLIDEILHYVVAQYRVQVNPQAMRNALRWLETTICGSDSGASCPALERTIRQFAAYFPPSQVYRQEIDLDTYLAGQSEGLSNRDILIEEMLMLWLANVNPAFSPYLELFDDEELEKTTVYGDKKANQIIPAMYAFFQTQPTFGPEGQNLIDMLRAPALAAPYSLTGQLEYILKKWGDLIGDKYLYRLLGGLDFVKEDTRIIIGVGGGGETPVYEFGDMGKEPERFTQDRDWMPSVVMIAKHTYVWLDQLSRKYALPIFHLDQIPDEELAYLARLGFSGLWLIGVWERSTASQKIKQWTGNPEAAASAYSLYDYQIAQDLGGEEAYQNLKERAWQKGIRLGADMVPNHTGIYSKWVVEHPDWYVSLPFSPFPSYNFQTGNLSEDGRVGIYLDEHYYTRSDAAVVFKRVDHYTGAETYIYHGNDGTSMPWNDTAQLNYLNPEVRETVIQTVLQVARRFPIIRFDAAMTLTKLHFQRLWFPEPGTGGAIPSRAEFGLTKSDFNAAMPEEFWREVVDRIAREAPDTLLLAEAFWMLEGFFVRTLGMHRVYNSAFMNMLRDEKNNEYRQVIKNTIEFDPEILKRYVNFMNNPDERTAVEQFGKGDKNMGICLLMATMPGLPMFGHGQVEGYAEKYGMEYRRAYWDETADPALIERHQREIAPLLHKRYLFADVKDFLLYDFYTVSGGVDENVFAYSNRSGSERALIVYHNRFGETRGWVKTSAAYTVKGPGEERNLVQRSLADGLGLRNEADWFIIFRDAKSGLEYIRRSQEIHQKGLYVDLAAYQYNIFMDFREVFDNEWHQYAQLEGYLGGRGIPSVDVAAQELFLQPVLYPFKELVNTHQFQRLLELRATTWPPAPSNERSQALDGIASQYRHLLGEIQTFTGMPVQESDLNGAAVEFRQKVEVVLSLGVLSRRLIKETETDNIFAQLEKVYKPDQVCPQDTEFQALFFWLCTHSLAKPFTKAEVSVFQGRAWMDEWMMNKMGVRVLTDMGQDETHAWRMIHISNVLLTHQDWYLVEHDLPLQQNTLTVLHRALEDPDIQRFLQINRHQGVLWFNHEAFEDTLRWMGWIAVIQILAGISEAETRRQFLLRTLSIMELLKKAEKASGYQVEKLIQAVHDAAPGK